MFVCQGFCWSCKCVKQTFSDKSVWSLRSSLSPKPFQRIAAVAVLFVVVSSPFAQN